MHPYLLSVVIVFNIVTYFLIQEPFVDTLDYIFMSKDWKVESVVSLPSKTELVGPLPVATEPSDHLLLSATVSLI